MIKCIILDDESHCIESLSNMIAVFPEKLQLLQSFKEPTKALIYLANNQIDLIFSDIQMNGMTGMEFAKKVVGKEKIIFTTAHHQYGADSYEYEAVDYLLKPIELDRFNAAIAKAEAQIKAVPKQVFVRSGSQKVHIIPDEITHIFAAKGYMFLHFKHKRDPLMVLSSLSTVEKSLKAYNIHRIHNSHMVNISHLINFDSNYAEVDTGYDKKTLPISNGYKNMFAREVEVLGG
jgi:two-component system, LytTR family, response regulator